MLLGSAGVLGLGLRFEVYKVCCLVFRDLDVGFMVEGLGCRV